MPLCLQRLLKQNTKIMYGEVLTCGSNVVLVKTDVIDIEAAPSSGKKIGLVIESKLDI